MENLLCGVSVVLALAQPPAAADHRRTVQSYRVRRDRARPPPRRCSRRRLRRMSRPCAWPAPLLVHAPRPACARPTALARGRAS